MLYSSPLITAYVLVVAGLLGLVMGSFINCWAWRYIQGESVVKGRSHCTTCGHDLGVLDLVPVFSWLFSGGKCRYCGEKVSARYPATELVLGIVFVAIVAVYGLSLETVELLAFSCILLFLSLTDLDDYLIPNGCIIAALAVRVAYLAITFALGTTTLDQIIYYAASAFGVGIALLVIVLVADFVFKRDSMGGGDLKLYFVAGLYFGWQQCLLLVIISCVFGIVVALVGSRRAMSAPDAPAEGLESAEEVGSAEGTTPAEGDREGVEIVEAAMPAENAAPDKVVEDGGKKAESVENATPAEDTAEDAEDGETESVLKRTIPFGPSIAAACVVIMLSGNSIITWYINLLS